MRCRIEHHCVFVKKHTNTLNMGFDVRLSIYVFVFVRTLCLVLGVSLEGWLKCLFSDQAIVA